MIVSLDHDQLEPRIQAHIYSNYGDDSWAETYWFQEKWHKKHPDEYNPRADIYAVVGCKAFKVKLKSITSKEHPIRDNSKPLVLGMSYGLTEFGLSWRLGCSTDRAKEIIRQLFRECPGMGRLYQDVREEVIKHERSIDMFGVVRHLPFDRRDKWSFKRAFRQAVNMKIQHPASAITLSGIVDFEEKYGDGFDIIRVPTKYSVILVAEVHDADVSDVRNPRLVPKLVHCMEHPSILQDYGIKLKVRLRVDEKRGDAWVK